MSLVQMGLLALIFLLVVGAVIAAATLLKPDPTKQRLQDMVGMEAGAATNSRWLDSIVEIAKPVGQLAMPEEGFEQSNIKLRFMHAGIRNPSAPGIFFTVKTVLTLGLPLVALAVLSSLGTDLKPTNLMLVLLILAALGYYGPNLWLARQVDARKLEIFENFPDALDLMTVCVEAGLGTESAMVRVAEDLTIKSPALSDELRIVNLELRAGADRAHALRNLAMRTGVDEVDSFVSMILQAERFGTSIATSLRIQSEVLRTKRRQKAEEAAAKIALKLLFPLIFFIFPSLMVVLMGPAFIQIKRVLLPTMAGGG